MERLVGKEWQHGSGVQASQTPPRPTWRLEYPSHCVHCKPTPSPTRNQYLGQLSPPSSFHLCFQPETLGWPNTLILPIYPPGHRLGQWRMGGWFLFPSVVSRICQGLNLSYGIKVAENFTSVVFRPILCCEKQGTYSIEIGSSLYYMNKIKYWTKLN